MHATLKPVVLLFGLLLAVSGCATSGHEHPGEEQSSEHPGQKSEHPGSGTSGSEHPGGSL